MTRVHGMGSETSSVFNVFNSDLQESLGCSGLFQEGGHDKTELNKAHSESLVNWRFWIQPMQVSI